ncbi:LPS export ABC transporter periplasmic protein LptC [Dendrosporobacter sp. 1207_IL3150]|uniref:LPS export ABC transporter periplasmic protein LptC n=1 Tax=Dendrosporobacter sp. 1207_IL3150 TaxID=3084054 RepID=UPI002FDB1F83
MNKKSYALIACIVLVLAFGVYYLFRDESPKELQQQQVKNEQTVNMTYSGNSIIEEQDGKRLWELSAETIEVDPKSKQAIIKNLRGVFYQDNGGKMEINAAQAVLDTKTRDIIMNGQVKAVSADGATFTAPTARWAGNDRRFYGSGGITMTRDDTVIIGDRIESDANMQKIKVEGNARIRKGGPAN